MKVSTPKTAISHGVVQKPLKKNEISLACFKTYIDPQTEGFSFNELNTYIDPDSSFGGRSEQANDHNNQYHNFSHENLKIDHESIDKNANQNQIPEEKDFLIFELEL